MNEASAHVFEWMDQRYPCAWPEEARRAWFGWYWTDARAWVARGGGQILGVTLARAVDDVARAGTDQSYHDAAGRVAFIDVSVNEGGAASWAAMIHALAERFPQCDRIAFSRLGRGDRVRVYPIHEFLNRLEKTYGQEHQS